MAQWQAHEITVESLLDKLRYAILGFLQPCFPGNLTARSQQRSAIRAIAERLTFCFAATASTTSSDMLNCRKRLYAMLTYLLFECLKSDQTYYSLLRLMALKVHEIARETFHQTHSRQLINKFRLEKIMEKYLGVLTDEDMHSLLDYLAFLASRHAKEASKQKTSDILK